MSGWIYNHLSYFVKTIFTFPKIKEVILSCLNRKKSYLLFLKECYELLKHLKKLKNISGLYTADFEDLYNSTNLIDLKNKLMVFHEKYNAYNTDIDHFTNHLNFIFY